VLAALRHTPGIGSDIAHVEPFTKTRGGFFACLATTRSGARLFAKCILSRGREARFWRVWREGGIMTEGDHYRLLPPEDVVQGAITTVLVFPAHPGLPIDRKKNIASYVRRVRKGVRALADFNSNHMDSALLGAFFDTGSADPPQASTLSKLESVYGFDHDIALMAANELRAVRTAWSEATAPLERAPRCLCHLDMGRGNVIFERKKATILDFGHAAIAPAGADLHTILRYARPREPGRTRFAEIYAAEFGRKGIDLDVDLARLAMNARFAARYTDPGLPSAQHRPVFLDALETAKALTERPRDS